MKPYPAVETRVFIKKKTYSNSKRNLRKRRNFTSIHKKNKKPTKKQNKFQTN